MARELKVEIIGDAKGFSGALKTAEGAVGGFGSALGKVAKVAVLAAGAAGIGAIAVTLKTGIDEFSESSKVAAQTEAALKSTGGQAGVTAQQIGDLATSLMRKSGVDDEAIQTSQNLLLAFSNVRNEVGAGNDIFNQASEAALNLSTRTGKGLNPTMIALGKVLNDPIKNIGALGRVGIQFDKGMKDQIKTLVEHHKTMEAQKLILAEVEKRVGGAAEAYGKTLPGQLAIAKESFSNISGELVAKLIPAFTSVLTWINSNWSTIGAVFDTVGNKVKQGLGIAADAVRAFVSSNAFQTAMEGIKTAAQAVVSWFQANWGTIKTVLDATWDGLKSGAETAFRVVKELVNGFLSFIKSDWGQTIAVATATFLTFTAAIKGIEAAVAIAKTALLGLSVASGAAGPLAIGLAAISLAVGFLVAKFLLVEGAVNSFAGAAKRAQSALDSLKGSIDRVTQAHISLDAATLAVQRATSSAAEAHKTADAAVKKYGASSEVAKTAVLAAKEADVAKRQAVLDLKTATDQAKDADAKRTAELNAGVGAVEKVRAKLVGLIQANKDGKLSSEALGKQYGNLWPELQKTATAATTTAQKLALTDPAASRAAAKTALYAQAIINLVTQSGKIPTKKELAVELKRINFDKFYADLVDVPKKSDSSGKEATTKFGAGVQPIPTKAGTAAAGAIAKFNAAVTGMGAAGFAAGSAAGSGLVRGLNSQLQEARAASQALQAAAKAGLQTWGSDAKEWTSKNVGEKVPEGLADGVKKKTPEAEKATEELKKKVQAKLDAAATRALARLAGSLLGEQYGAGILEGMDKSGDSVREQSKKTAALLRFAEPLIKKAGRTIGEEHAKEIVAGVLGMSTTLKAQLIKALTDPVLEAQKATRDKLIEAATKAAEAAKPAIQMMGMSLATIDPETRAKAREKLAADARAILGAATEAIKAAAAQPAQQIFGMSLVAIDPALRAQARENAAALAKEAADAIRSAKGEFASAWTELSSAALSAFDQMAATWVSPAQKALDAMNAAEQVAKLKADLESGAAGLDEAKGKLAEALSGGDPEAIKTAQAAVTTAQTTFDAAVIAQQKATLAQQAIDQVAAHTEQIAEDRRSLNARLTELQTKLAMFPEKHKAIQAQIIALIRKFGQKDGDYQKAGELLTDALADGLNNKVDDAVKAAQNVMNKIRENLGGVITVEIRAEAAKPPGKQHGGSVDRDQPYIVGEAGPELFVPSRSGQIVPNNRLNSSATAAGIHFHFHGPVYTSEADLVRSIADPVRRELLRRSRGRGLGLA